MTEDTRRRPTTGQWLLAGLAVAALLIVLILWGEPVWRLFQQREAIAAFAQRSGPLGPLVIVLLQFAQTVLAPIPGHVVGVVGGYLYGLWLGTLYSMVGTLLGAFLALVLVRKYGRPAVERYVSSTLLARLDRYSSSQDSLFLFVAFLFPLIPSDMALLAAGLTDLSIPWIMVLVVLGRLPGVMMSVAVGVYALELSLTEWGIFIVVLLLAVLLFYRYGKRLEALSLRVMDRILG